MSAKTISKTIGDLINCYEQAYRSNGTLGMAEVLLDNIHVMDSLNCDTSMQVRIISQQIDCLISAQNHIISTSFAEIADVSGELIPELPFPQDDTYRRMVAEPDELPFPEVANG